MAGLLVLGLALSCYLGWHYVMGGVVIGCGGGSPCEEVLSSRWSAIGGVVPVSGLAAGAYLAMLVASFCLGPETEAAVRQLAWRAILVLSGAAAGSAVWFIIVQKWYIGAFCPYCMATHITGLLLTALVIWRAPREMGGNATTPTLAHNGALTRASRGAGRWQVAGLALAGVALAGVMAGVQLKYTPPSSYSAGQSPVNDLPVLDPHAGPMIGSPDAQYVVTLLFDYNCPHCQQLHTMLDEVVRRYHGQLAFALCPAPLNPACNPYVPRVVDEFRDSCELTRIALAVWVANREAFPAFDRWMYSPEPGQPWRARSLDEATAKAKEMVGAEKFTAAQANPWIDQYLQASIRIFGEIGRPAVPKLIRGPRWVCPEPNNVDDLLAILRTSLALPEP